MPAAIVPLAMSLIETGVGAANKSAASKEAKRLRETRPVYNISPESQDELSLAESELQGGMGSRAARAYELSADKATSSSLSAILKGGGNVNNIGDLYGAVDEGRQNLYKIQENLRLNQIMNTVNARRNMTDQRDKSFLYNKDQWWKADAQNNANNRQNADQQMWAGINGFASTGTNLWENAWEAGKMDDYLNPGAKENAAESKRISRLGQQDYNPTAIGSNDVSNGGYNRGTIH